MQKELEKKNEETDHGLQREREKEDWFFRRCICYILIYFLPKKKERSD
jgi:hypothetical protein